MEQTPTMARIKKITNISDHSMSLAKAIQQ